MQFSRRFIDTTIKTIVFLAGIALDSTLYIAVTRGLLYLREMKKMDEIKSLGAKDDLDS